MRKTKVETDRYYDLLHTIRSDDDWQKVLVACQESLRYLRSLVVECKRMTSDNRFDITEIPAIEIAAKYLAVLDRSEDLRRLRSAVKEHPELEGWLSRIDDAQTIMDYANRIYELARHEQGVLQKDLKTLLSIDGSLAGEIVYYMAKIGRLSKSKEGNSNRLRAIPVAEA